MKSFVRSPRTLLSLLLALPLASLSAQTTLDLVPGQNRNDAIDTGTGNDLTASVAAGTASISGTISGNGSVTKTGDGSLIFTANNTYDGGTTISAGTLQIGNGGAAGSITGDVTNHGTLVFNRSDDFTFNGVISGSGGIVQDGNILRLTAAQTYTGPTSIKSGAYLVLPTTTDQGLSAATTVDIAAGGFLDLSNRALTLAGLTGAGAVYSFGGNAGHLTLDIASSNTFAGRIGGADRNFAVTKVGDGTLTLAGNNTYTGVTTINGGTLQSAHDISLSTTSAIAVNNAGTTLALNYGGLFGYTQAQAAALLAKTTFGVNTAILALDTTNATGPVTYGGALTMNAGFTKRGAGTLVLSGNNTYSGVTTIEGGTLQSARHGSLSTTSAIAVNNPGTTLALNYGGPSDYTQEQATALLAKTTFGVSTTFLAFDTANATGPATYGDVLAMNAGFTKLGAGTLVLTENNTYTGATLIAAGTLQLGNGGATGSITGDVTNYGTLAFNRSDDVTFSGVISGHGGVINDGNILRFSAVQTFTSPLQINSGTVVLPTTVNAGLSPSTVVTVASGARLDMAGRDQKIAGLAGAGFVYSYGSPGSTLILDVPEQHSHEFAGSIGFFSDSQDFGLMKMGAGTQTLSGANTYTGTTTIGNPNLWVPGGALSYVGAGTLQIGNGGTTGSLNPTSPIANHATLIFNRSDTITQGTDFGTISGPGRVIQRGGTLVLNSSNTFIGGTVIEQGTLQIGTGGTTGSLVGPVANAGTVVFDRSDDYTFNGVISGSGGLVQNGGILRFSFAHYYTGPTVINSGTLVLPTGGDHGISSASALTIAAGARLDLSNRELILSGLTGGGTIYSFGGSAGHLRLDVARGQSYDFHGTLGGADPAFAFSKSGLGTFVLSGANTYTGATTLLGGTLSIDFDAVSANVLPSASSLVASGGKLAFTGAGTQTLNGLTATAGTANSIVLGANQTLALGALTSAGTGSSLHFNTSAGGIVTFTGQTAGAVLSPGFTVLDSDGFGYATVNDFGQVVRLTTATDLLPASGALSTTAYTMDNNASDSNAAGSSTLALSASAAAGAILVDTTADGGTLKLNSGVVLRNNSWNFRGEGSHAYTIAGSGGGAGLRPVATGDTLVINNYSSGLVTFASPILADGSNALVVNGTGTTVLSGASTYTGGTTVNGGTLQMGDGVQSLSLGRPTGVWGANGYLSAGHDGADGGIAVVVNGNGSLTTLTGVTLTGGAGGAGGTGGSAQQRTVSSFSEVRNLFSFTNGLRGGDGGAGGAGVSLETNGTVNVWKATGGAGGNGGRGGTGSLYQFVYNSFVSGDDSGTAGTGGTGGTGGVGLTVANGFAPALSGGTITGGAGGAGGPGGWGTYHAVTGAGGRGGDGGAGIIVGASGTLDFQAVTGGKGGIGGAGGVFGELDGYGPIGPSGIGGTGGAGVIEFGGSTITVLSPNTIAGGVGGAGFFGTTPPETSGSGDGGDGGDGGVGMLFSSGGTLINGGTIAGGNGGAGGDATFVINAHRPGVAGDGGDGGAGVVFEGGGTLTNSGTIRGGNGGAAGSARFAGVAGRAAPGVTFSGGAGTFTNQDGGIIHGGVSMENVANTVTLETGSQIVGALSIGTHASSTLTLSGSGAATYSQAVTGATTFAGSLTKTGSGTWTLDRTFTYTGTTTVDEGTLLLTGSLGNTAVSVGAGATLGGEGSIGAGGSLTLNGGASLFVDGSTPGALFVGGDLTLHGTITVAMLSGTPGQPNRVLNYSGSLSGSAANFSTTHVRNPVFSTSTPNQIDLTFDAAKALTWSGSTATWDVNSTANWDGGSEKFFQLDSVTFDDTGTTKNVLLAADVAPASTTFANGVGHDYTLTGSGMLSSEVVHNGDGNVTIGVLLGGTSSVTKSGAGTLTLTAANSYTGATTINGGILQLGDGGTTGSLSPASAITNNGTLVFNRSDIVTQGIDFANIISGTGALSLQGGGTLVLTGSNTYTGGTTVSAGTLQIGNGGASGSLVGTVTNHDAVIFQRSDDYTFTGVVSGGGSVTHRGNTLRFTAAQNYTGPTRIDSGLLVLSPTMDNGLSPLTVVTIASGASLDLSGRNQTLAGIEGGGTITSSNSSGSSLTLTVGSGVSQEFSGSLGGSAPHFGLTKSGEGTQILSGTNTYSGGTTISGGTLQIGNGGATGSITGSVENHGILVFNRNNDYTFDGVVSGSGAVVHNGHILRFSAAQTYTGPTQLNSGVLVLTSSADHGLSPSTVVTFAPGAGLDLSGRNQTLAGIEGGGSIYSFNSSGSTLTLDVGAGNSYAFSGSVGGAYPNFSLIKSGEGTQILSGANTHSGGTTISGGTLRIGNGGATGTIAGNITNNGTLEFRRTGDYVFSGIISGSGDFSTAGATLRFSAAHLYTGATRIESGILVLPTTTDNGLSSSTVVTVASGAKLDLSRRNQTLAGIEGGGEIYSFNSSGSTLTLDVGAGKSYAFTGNLGSADPNFGLIKSGEGTQTLSGANTYTGGTIVRGGILNLANTSGSALGTGSVTIESGAFLTGTGSFTGALTVNAGGMLAPGNSAGLLTIGSGSVFNGTVALQIGGLLRGIEYDAIDVGGAGALTFGGTLELSLIGGFAPASGDTFDLFDFAIGIGAFDILNFPDLTAGLWWDTSNLYDSGILSVSGSAIPEPSTVALYLGLCALAAGLIRRRMLHTARTERRD